jgi:hypothetical protein
MVHELRIYTFRPRGLAQYLPLAGGIALQIRGPELGVLQGFWLGKRGEHDVAYHLWQYDSLDHRQSAREALMADPRWNQEFLRHILPLLAQQELRFLAAASAAPAPEPARAHWRLDTAEAAPGRLPELLAQMRERCAEHAEHVQLFTGISPWPNSVTVLSGGFAADATPPWPEDVQVRESIALSPSYFSPLQ